MSGVCLSQPRRPTFLLQKTIEVPARFRISDQEPLDGREMFFDDEAEARAWYRDDIADPDPEVGAVGLWAIGDTNDRLLDCPRSPP